MNRSILLAGVVLFLAGGSARAIEHVLPGSYFQNTVGSNVVTREFIGVGNVWHDTTGEGAQAETLVRVYSPNSTAQGARVYMLNLTSRGDVTPITEGVLNFRLDDPWFYTLTFSSRQVPNAAPNAFDVEFSLDGQEWTLADVPQITNNSWPGYINRRIDLPGLLDAGDHSLQWRATNMGPNVVANLQIRMVVPEPTTWTLLAMLCMVAVVIAWHRRHRADAGYH